MSNPVPATATIANPYGHIRPLFDRHQAVVGLYCTAMGQGRVDQAQYSCWKHLEYLSTDAYHACIDATGGGLTNPVLAYYEARVVAFE